MIDILSGDCRVKLDELEKSSVQCCITSPPYWQLRDYCSDDELGQEDSPEEYADTLVDVFRKVHNVLKKDGILFLNLGDTYCGGGGYCPGAPSNQSGSKQSTNRGSKSSPRPVPKGYKPKDLVGFPWLVASALRRDGWYLRSDIIWDKTNCMPEKVTDRPTRSHEYIFMLSKSRTYYYDHDAAKTIGINGKPRNIRTVWSIAKSNKKSIHTAVFPPQLVEPCVLVGSRPGDLILDPFAGSGTVGSVALQHQRNFIGIELNEEYVDFIKQRLKKEAVN